jgi:hypothetical protein
MDFLGSFIGGGTGGGSKEFGSSTATTTFGDLNAGGKGAEAWLPLAVLGGLGFILALVLVLALKK